MIVFSDIGKHLYEPVKTYSRGMHARLSFATNINVDVLLVDEVLAIGDVFQRKRYTRLNKLKAQGIYYNSNS